MLRIAMLIVTSILVMGATDTRGYTCADVRRAKATFDKATIRLIRQQMTREQRRAASRCLHRPHRGRR